MVKTGPSSVMPSCWTIHTTGSEATGKVQSVMSVGDRCHTGSVQSVSAFEACPPREQQQIGVERWFQPDRAEDVHTGAP